MAASNQPYGTLSIGYDATSEGFDCKICLFPIEQPVTTTCGHVFCWHCLREWLRDRKTCPICRRDVSKAQQHDYVSGDRDQRAISSRYYEEPGYTHGFLSLEPTYEDTQLQFPTSVVSDSSNQPSWLLLSETTSANGHLPANEQRHRDRIPTTTFPSAATHQVPNSEVSRASNRNDFTGHQVFSNDEVDPDVSHYDNHKSIVIDFQQMSAAIRTEANKQADSSGISQRLDYSQAAKVVYGQWRRMLGRKTGQTMHRYDLMWLMAEEMDLALADAGIVDFTNGEVIPRRLSNYLRDVARAAIDL